MDFVKAILAAEFDPVRRPFFARVHEYLRRAASREGAGSGLVDHAIDRLVAGGQLDDREARALFEQIVDGESSDDQIGALLVALRPDVLPALGVVVTLDAPGVEACIDRVGIGFMFAPLFPRAFGNVQRIRRALAEEMPPDLGQRSVFNVLGPLANPANAGRQIVGVYEEALVAKVAEVLRLLRVDRALVA